MYIALILASFIGSLAFSLLLRRLDKSGWKTAQIKRVGETREQQLEAVANKQLQAIKDALLDYEIMLRQGQKSRTELSDQMLAYEERIESVRGDREAVEEIADQLAEIAKSANHVNERVHKLDAGLERLALAERDMDELSRSLSELDQRIEQKGRQAEETLSNIVSRLISETEERTLELTDNVRSSFQLLQNEFRSLETKLDEHRDTTSTLGERIHTLSDRLEEKWNMDAGQMEQRFHELDEQAKERARAIEGSLSTMRTKAVEGMQSEIQRIRADLDDFNLEAITRRDEILNETRRMAEGMKDEMSAFRENYLAAENKLLKDAEQYHRETQKRLGLLKDEWDEADQERVASFEERVGLLREEVDELRKERDQAFRTETNETRESLRQLIREGAEQIERETLQAQEQLREQARDEERELKNWREETQQLRENLSYLGQELKAGLRSESEHAIHLLREARKEEEEHFERGRSDLEALRHELTERINGVERELARAEELRSEIEEIATGTIEMMESRQAAAMETQANHLRDVAEELTDSVTNNLSSVDGRVAELANEVQEQIGLFSEEKEALESQLKGLDEEIQRRGQEQRDLVAGLHSEFRAELEKSGKRFHGELARLLQKYQAEMQRRVERLQSDEQRLSQQMIELTDNYGADLSERLAEVHAARGSLREEVDRLVDRAQAALQEARASEVEELEERAERFMNEQDDKLKRASETMDEKISRQLMVLADRGQLQIEELEKRTARTIQEAVARMEGDLTTAHQHFQELRGEVQSEMEAARAIKEEVIHTIQEDNSRLAEFESRLEAIDKAEELVQSFDETVEILTDRLALAREENSKLDEYVRNFETVRQNRKELEGELRMLESQRGRLSEAESLFLSLEKRIEELNEKFRQIGEAQELAKLIEKRVHQFNEFKKSFESYYAELGDRRTFVEEALQEIEHSREEAIGAQRAAADVLQQVERAEIRQRGVNDYLKDVEARASALRHLDGEIQKVEARFEQMDGLLIDLDEKQKQISTMSRRLDGVENSGREIMTELESVVSEADERMDRLAAFYQTVDHLLDEAGRLQSGESEPELVSVRAGRRSVSIPEHKKNGILSLYLNHKWEPDLIAERMKVDPAVVRAVIASQKT